MGNEENIKKAQFFCIIMQITGLFVGTETVFLYFFCKYAALFLAIYVVKELKVVKQRSATFQKEEFQKIIDDGKLNDVARDIWITDVTYKVWIFIVFLISVNLIVALISVF